MSLKTLFTFFLTSTGLLLSNTGLAQKLGSNALPEPALSNYTNRIIIEFQDKTSTANTSSTTQVRPQQLHTHNGLNLKHKRGMSGGRDVYALDKNYSLTEAKQIAAALMQQSNIAFAEPDARRFPKFTPSDNNFGDQWYFLDAEPDGSINIQTAWDITRGNSSTVIAVLDTGTLPHDDLSRVLSSGFDFISEDAPGNFFTANDGDGRDNDPADAGDSVLADECGSGSEAANSSWHGTIINGLLIADINDARVPSMAGMDHMGQVLPVRVLGKCGGFTSDIADAIRWAAGESISGVPNNSNIADVINLSFGGAGNCSSTEQNAINAAVTRGVPVVVAAGNEGTAVSNSSPANCDNVITVAASTRQGGETCYTNVGAAIDISAPGGNGNTPPCSGTAGDALFSTINIGTSSPNPATNSFAFAAGTSFSTPLVSGAIALMKAVSPNLSPEDIEVVLKHTARAFPTGTSDSFRDCNTTNCGAGILDVQAAVSTVNGNSDSTPDAFSFTDQTGVETGTANVTSNTITVNGIDLPSLISISSGEYAIDSGTFTNQEGIITNGQTVTLRVNASANFSASASATITIGGVSDTFTVTTEENPDTLNLGGGGGGSFNLATLLVIWLALLGLPRVTRLLHKHNL